VTELNESLVDAARSGTGLDTVYRALDHLVDRYALVDATVVVDVPGFGRQVLHAGRRPLRDDESGLHAAPTGLYLDPPIDDPVLAELVVALGVLGLRHDASVAPGAPGAAPGSDPREGRA
jgi:D-serine deaminase-like pyridoxal phosphate-dependent protein